MVDVEPRTVLAVKIMARQYPCFLDIQDHHDIPLIHKGKLVHAISAVIFDSVFE